MNERAIRYSGGVELISIGQEFDDGPRRWRIEAIGASHTYSPSGMGGTPIVRCKLLAGEIPPGYRQYMTIDDCVDWCGDSVAAHVALSRRERKHEALGGESTDAATHEVAPKNG